MNIEFLIVFPFLGIITDRRLITEDSPAKLRTVYDKLNSKYTKNTRLQHENDRSTNISVNIGTGATRSISPDIIESKSNNY